MVAIVAASLLYGGEAPVIMRWMINGILVAAVFSEVIAFVVRRRVIEAAAA